jgi:hypothetical protein
MTVRAHLSLYRYLQLALLNREYFALAGNPGFLKGTLQREGLAPRILLRTAMINVAPHQEGVKMLWTIFVVLLVLWLLGFVGFHVLGAYIHILLLIALIVLVFQLLSGRRAL